MRTLKQSAVDKILDGTTTVEEVYRVVSFWNRDQGVLGGDNPSVPRNPGPSRSEPARRSAMRGVFSRVVGALVVPGLLVLAFHPGSAQADDTSFFGRLFRLGGSSSSSSSTSSSTSSANSTSAGQSGFPGSQAPLSAFGDIGTGGSFFPSGSAASRTPNPTSAVGPISSEGPSPPDLSRSQDG